MRLSTILRIISAAFVRRCFEMDANEPAAKLALRDASDSASAGEAVGSDTESEGEVATMTVMGEAGNIDIDESLPNPDDAEEAAFAGQCAHAHQLILGYNENPF